MSLAICCLVGMTGRIRPAIGLAKLNVGKEGGGRFERDAAEVEGFVRLGVSRAERNAGCRDLENGGEEFDEGGVGFAGLGGLGDFDFEGVAEGANDF